MFQADYKWHFDFVRLALDTGFHFEKHKKENSVQDRIYTIDIDRLIKNRDLETVEKLIPFVIQYSLDADQARILDDTFVKTFRLSQLAIEYLLFCKQYLDNSLIHFKKEKQRIEEENKELKLFVDDLKQHVNTLMQELKEKTAIPTFKCTECNKVFSTEEFLNSHKKRRHSFTDLRKESDQQLHLEIKELKGRLNSAEKLIQQEQNQICDNKSVDDLQQKFENLKLFVESELKLLGTQQNFAEKYERWVEKLALNYKTQINKEISTDLVEKRESTTQTDIFNQSVENIEEKQSEMIIELAQKQITTMGDNLQSKVSESLEKIEKQMDELWKRINKNEKTIMAAVVEVATPPPIKPRSKFTLKKEEIRLEENNKVVYEVENKNIKGNVKKSDKNEEVEQKTELGVDIFDLGEGEEEEDKSFQLIVKPLVQSPVKQEEEQEEEIQVQINKSSSEITSSDIETETEDDSQKQSISSLKKLGWDSGLSEDFQNDVEKILIKRLQDLGVSPDWTGLPSDSFKRALQIVNHQGNLLKKTYPDFDQLSSSLEKDLLKNLFLQPKKQPSKTQKILKDSPSPQLVIKNRKMYDTDSDSEQIKPKTMKKNVSSSMPFNAVIEELKTVTRKYSDSEQITNSLKEIKNQNDEQTKSVLKNYQSIGGAAAAKKKVLFDLKSEKENKPYQLKHPKSGSSTSVASSVFDSADKIEKTTTIVKPHGIIEDLSDFDYSLSET